MSLGRRSCPGLTDPCPSLCCHGKHPGMQGSAPVLVVPCQCLQRRASASGAGGLLPPGLPLHGVCAPAQPREPAQPVPRPPPGPAPSPHPGSCPSALCCHCPARGKGPNGAVCPVMSARADLPRQRCLCLQVQGCTRCQEVGTAGGTGHCPEPRWGRRRGERGRGSGVSAWRGQQGAVVGAGGPCLALCPLSRGLTLGTRTRVAGAGQPVPGAAHALTHDGAGSPSPGSAHPAPGLCHPAGLEKLLPAPQPCPGRGMAGWMAQAVPRSAGAELSPAVPWCRGGQCWAGCGTGEPGQVPHVPDPSWPRAPACRADLGSAARNTAQLETPIPAGLGAGAGPPG